MELWASAILIVLGALVIDRFIGDFPNAIHPIRWMGNVVGWFDRRIKNRYSRYTKLWGFITYLFIFIVFWIMTMIICSGVRILLGEYTFILWNYSFNIGEIAWIILMAFFFKQTMSIFLFRKFCKPIQDDLKNGKVDEAASKLQMLVSRDTKKMNPSYISSACCETTSENLVDSAISPSMYFGFLGMFGALLFRCANTMDAMWGYLNDKYSNIGYFPAKFDDVLGYVTSRISIVFVILSAKILHMNTKDIISVVKSDHNKTPSPNSGWSMSAVAAALEISMEKKDVYVIGKGQLPTVEDISRCCRLVEVTSIIFLMLVTLPLFIFIGIHIQIYFENMIFGFLDEIL